MFFWREPRNRGMRRSQLLTVIIFIIVLHDVVSAFQSPSDRNTSERRRKRKSRIRKSLLSCDDPLWMYYCQCQPDPTWSHSHPTASHMNLDQSPPPHTQTDTNTHTEKEQEMKEGDSEDGVGELSVCKWERLIEGKYRCFTWQHRQMENEKGCYVGQFCPRADARSAAWIQLFKWAPQLSLETISLSEIHDQPFRVSWTGTFCFHQPNLIPRYSAVHLN